MRNEQHSWRKLRAHWDNSMHWNLPCVEKSKEKLVMCIKMFNGLLLVILKKFNAAQKSITKGRLSWLYFN